MTKVKYQIKPPSDPAYIGSPDTTFAGSRNGFSAMILWDYVAHHGNDKQVQTILAAEEVAKYAYDQLAKLSAELGTKHGKTEEEKKNWLWVARSPASLAIRFRRPNKEIVKEFSLSGESMYVDAPGKGADEEGIAQEKQKPKQGNVSHRVQRDYAHIYIMTHVTKEKIDHLIDVLSQHHAFDSEGESPHPARQKSERQITFTQDPQSPTKPHGGLYAIIEEYEDLKAHAFHAHNNRRGF